MVSLAGSTPKGEPKPALKLSNYLGVLEADPDDASAIAEAQAIVASGDPERLGEEPTRLLEMARQGHEDRGEFATVAKLIEVELVLVQAGGQDQEHAAALWKELGRIRSELLLEPESARAAYQKALELKPDDGEVTEALRRLEQAEASWKKFAKRFVEEAESAADLSLKTSLLLRAACLAWQWKKKGKSKEADKLFTKVLELDAGNMKAALLYEHTLREREEWSLLAQHLLDTAEAARDKQDRINMYVRAARTLARKLGDKNRAAASYERALDFDPTQAEALAYLSEHFAAGEQWDHLVGLYEDALRVPQKLDVEQGILLQIGMVHWRMRGKADDAERHFARLRKLDPTHPAMLDFYRSFYGGSSGKADSASASDVEALIRILSDAQRVSADHSHKVALASEAARLSSGVPSMTERAIESWKVVQRLSPENDEAAGVLKELYAKSEKWNALVEVLKTQIDATPDSAVARKVELLREIAGVYRDRLRLDGMLINAYNAILRIAPTDRTTLAALSEKYRELGRWNDLINVLTLDADLQTDTATKIDTYLKVAQLWIEHFSNYNQAASPLEKVLELDPQNSAALSRLREIYEKKRAWKQLFEVLKKEHSVTTDKAARAKLTVAMAELAADRLHRYQDAVSLWREVVDSGEQTATALDALEKLAEREKDWKTLAEVLELQVAREKTDEGRIRVLLKLGGLHTERTSDPEAASRAWRRVLEADPKQGRALRSLRDSLLSFGEWDALEALYERAGDFEGLVDVLSGEADRADKPELKIDLSFRAARMFEEKIGEPQRAQRSYERVLAVDPQNARAARSLAPIYEHEEKWSRLCAVLDIVRAGLGDKDKAQKLELLAKLRKLAQEKLRDGELAFGYALAAYQLAPENAAVRQSFEASAEVAQAWDRVIELYKARADKAGPDEALALHRRVAEIAGDRMSLVDVAAAQWQSVLALAPSDNDALSSLDRIYRAGNRPADVRALLAHKLEHEKDPEARAALLRELASLEEDKLQDPDAAAKRYRELAKLEPEARDVWSALDRLATAADRKDELAAVLEKRRVLETERPMRTELGSRLGALLLDQPDKRAQAAKVFGEVLELEPAHGPAVAALTKLAEEPADNNPLRAGILVQLEHSYEQVGRFDKLAAVIQQRLTLVKEEVELRRLRLRLAEISGGKLGDAMGAYASLEAAFLEEPGDTSLWDRLAEAAERAGQHKALANAYALAIDEDSVAVDDKLELAKRTARIYDEVLNEPGEAEAFHKRVLLAEPLSEPSFVALKELYTDAERWDELQAIYRKRIEETVDGEQKLDLLLQLCFLFEEILDRPEMAIDTYQTVLELSPDHGPSRRTLEKLYERTERHRDLANLLRQNLDQAEGYDSVDLMYRLGELHETKLSEPAAAVDNYEGALRAQPHHLRAQAALARLLSVPSQRQRVAAILEPVYETQGAYEDLARVLEIQLADRETPDAKAALLLRIGELHDQRLRDPEAAFGAFARAVESDPSDKLAREAMARVAKARETFRRKRATVLERAALATSDVDVQIELLMELAQLLEEYLDDKPAAERAYDRLLGLANAGSAGGRDDIVLEVSRALERLHIHAGDHARLAQDLERQIELVFDPTQREQLLVRLSDLYEEKLGNVDGAIAAQRKRLELTADNADALLSLERLLSRAQKWSELADLLARRAELSSNDAERRELGRRVATVYEEKLGNVERAIESYNDLLSSFGPSQDTLRSLARLYDATSKHQELFDTLEAEEAITDASPTRAALRFRMAELLREKLGNPERAISAYEGALEDDPQHAVTLSSLDTIMRDASSPVRREAARIAAPRYEAMGNFDKLLGVLDLLAETDDEHERLTALTHAADVAERGQNAPGQAMAYIGRALKTAHSHDSLGELLTRYGKLADTTSGYAEYVARLQEVAPEIFDAEQKTRAYRRIGEVARDKLNDTALARTSFRRVLEDLPDDLPALDALLVLDQEAGDHAALIDVLKRKTELSTDPAERSKLLARQAEVYELGLDDADKAIEALEELLIDTPSAAAYASLERLYQRTHRWTDLGALYQAQLDRKIGNRVEVHFRLARNARQHLSDTVLALDHLRDAIDDDAKHSDSIALLESIMSEQGEHRSVAAEILEPGYLARREWEKLTSALRARVDAEPDLEERKRLLVRLGRIYEEQLEDFDETMEIYARLFREDPRDEEAWETLTRLAKVGGQWSRLAKILGDALPEAAPDEVLAKLARYVGSLYDERVVNLVKAAEFYEKALELDSQDSVSFAALESAYRRSADHASLLGLYRRQIDAAATDARRIELLHKTADLHATEQKDRASTITTYREILDIDPDNAPAVSGVERMLSEGEDWQGMAEHLGRRIEHHLGSPNEVPLKYRLGELRWTKLNDENGALEVFEEIASTHPEHTPTVTALERLVQDERLTLRVTETLEPVYRHLDQWKKLIAVDEARLALVSEPAESVRLLAEIAQLHEARGADLGLAFHAHARAFALEPDNDATRAHVDRLANRRNAWDEHVAAYESAIAAASDESTKARLLTTVARVHDEKRGDPRAAIEAYERLLAFEPDDPSTLDALEGLHTMVGDWRGLIAVLERKVKAAFSADERGDVLRRIGSVLEDLLGDRDAAVQAYKRALDEVDSDELALDALDRLYAGAGRASELAQVLARRIELSQDPEQRAEVGVRLGVLLEDSLHRFDEAIDAYRRVLDDDAHNSLAVTRLEVLYERQGQWHELLDNLSLQASMAGSTAQRARLRGKAGRVLQHELAELGDAIDYYRQALDEEPHHEEAIQALMGLTANAEHHARAAEVVEPLLRTQQRWDDLVQLIGRRVDSILDPIERKAELVRLAEVQEHGRKDPTAAFEALARALLDDAADVFVQDELTRLATSLGNWSRLCGVFMDRASHLSDPSDAAALYRRAGAVADEQLHDDARAIEAYVRASEHDDDALDTLAALDRLYDKTQQWEPLVDVLERRIGVLAGPEERAELLLRLGQLRDAHFSDGRGAFVAYQEILDHDPLHAAALAGMESLGTRDDLARDVLEVLDRAYREAGALEKVAGLYDIKIRLAQADGEKVGLLKEAAAIWEHDLHEPRRALSALRRAYELDSGDFGLLDDLERLADAANAWDTLSGLAEAVIASGALDGSYKRDLAARAVLWYRDHIHDMAGEERCLRAVLAIDPEELDMHERLTEILRTRGDAAALAPALKAFAEVTPDVSHRAALLTEAAPLYRQAGDSQTAAECYEGVLDCDAGDANALSALAEIRLAQHRYPDAVTLLTRWLAVENDPKQRTELRYRIAQAQEGPLREPEHAVATYRALLDEQPDEARAEAALEGLLERLEDFTELEELLRTKLERASSVEARTALRARLARLSEERLAQPDTAIEHWTELLAEAPDDAQGQTELERLYRKTERGDELMGFLLARAAHATQKGDHAAAADKLWSLTKLYEAAGDTNEAIASVGRIHELQPTDRKAVEELVRLCREAERWSDVAELLQTLITLQPTNEAVASAYQLAELANDKLQDPALTETALRKALELDPSRAETRDKLKDHLEAQKAYDKLAQLLAAEAETAATPAEQAALWNRTASLYADKLADPGRAVAYLERAVALAPEDRPALLSLCDLYIAAGRQTDAIPVLEKIIASYGGRRAKEVAIYEHRLGQAYEASQRLDDALKHYDAAFKIDLTSVPVLRDLGRLCLARGDLDRAQKTYRALLLQKLGPDQGIQKADVYFHLGEISVKQGDKTKAKAMLERAITEAGSHAEAKALLAEIG